MSVAYRDTTSRLPDFGNTTYGAPGGRSIFDGVRSTASGRPSVKLGFSYKLPADYIPAERLKDNTRKGDEDGDYGIHRRGAKVSDAVPRNPKFDQVQALDLGSVGNSIELGEATLRRLFDVEIPDPDDRLWLEEKARLTALYQARGLSRADIVKELKINKPLSRDQRTTRERRNIGEASLDSSQKLAEIEEEIKEGRAESRAQQATLAGQIAVILGDIASLQALTIPELRNISSALARLDVPRSRKELGIQPNIIDSDFYFANAGLVNLYLFNSLRFDPDFKDDSDPNGLNYLNPLHTVAHAKQPTARVPSPPPVVPKSLTFHSMITQIQGRGNGRRFLDLDNRLVINIYQMRALVSGLPNGFSNPEVSVASAHR